MTSLLQSAAYALLCLFILDIMTCNNIMENMKYTHQDDCRYYITCSRNQSWLIKCSETTNGKSRFYNGEQKHCANREGCFTYQGDVCYGARDNSYGLVKVTKTGYINKVKLVHQSGYLSNSRQAGKSKWGFPTDKNIGTLVTDTNDKVLFGALYPYSLENFNAESDYLTLINVTTAYVKLGNTLRVWYSEDIRDFTESDNHGKHCITVYAVFSD